MIRRSTRRSLCLSFGFSRPINKHRNWKRPFWKIIKNKCMVLANFFSLSSFACAAEEWKKDNKRKDSDLRLVNCVFLVSCAVGVGVRPMSSTATFRPSRASSCTVWTNTLSRRKTAGNTVSVWIPPVCGLWKGTLPWANSAGNFLQKNQFFLDFFLLKYCCFKELLTFLLKFLLRFMLREVFSWDYFQKWFVHLLCHSIDALHCVLTKFIFFIFSIFFSFFSIFSSFFPFFFYFFLFFLFFSIFFIFFYFLHFFAFFFQSLVLFSPNFSIEFSSHFLL